MSEARSNIIAFSTLFIIQLTFLVCGAVDKRRLLYSLQLVHHNPITTTITDSLIAQFKANVPAEIDSDSDNPDIRQCSYTREQKLVAVGYVTTKQV